MCKEKVNCLLKAKQVEEVESKFNINTLFRLPTRWKTSYFRLDYYYYYVFPLGGRRLIFVLIIIIITSSHSVGDVLLLGEKKFFFAKYVVRLFVCYLAKTKFLQDMLVTLYVFFCFFLFVCLFFLFFFCLCVIIGFVPV